MLTQPNILDRLIIDRVNPLDQLNPYNISILLLSLSKNNQTRLISIESQPKEVVDVVVLGFIVVIDVFVVVVVFNVVVVFIVVVVVHVFDVVICVVDPRNIPLKFG